MRTAGIFIAALTLTACGGEQEAESKKNVERPAATASAERPPFRFKRFSIGLSLEAARQQGLITTCGAETEFGISCDMSDARLGEISVAPSEAAVVFDDDHLLHLFMQIPAHRAEHAETFLREAYGTPCADTQMTATWCFREGRLELQGVLGDPPGRLSFISIEPVRRRGRFAPESL